jgi:hypothetical protein
VRLFRKSLDASVYCLADHLDAVLAAGEDLLRAHLTISTEAGGPARLDELSRLALQRRFVETVRTLELALAMRVLQARQRAEELRRADPRVAPVAGLFIGGTAALADAAAELGDWTGFDFQTGNEMVSYLRSRGVIARDSAGLIALSDLTVTARFRIGRRIELGPLLDLAATFLDALELFYELYDEREEASEAHVADAPARQPDRTE